jgi:hypothetical protein
MTEDVEIVKAMVKASRGFLAFLMDLYVALYDSPDVACLYVMIPLGLSRFRRVRGMDVRTEGYLKPGRRVESAAELEREVTEL